MDQAPPQIRVRPLLFVAVCLSLVVVVLVVFWQTSRFEFLSYDDHSYVTKNLQVRAGLSRASISWAFTSFHAANWHPITWLSHMLDVQLFGLNPKGHHLTSVGIHAINAILLFLVLNQMTGCLRGSALTAFLFAVHPLHVESVAWIAERKDVKAAIKILPDHPEPHSNLGEVYRKQELWEEAQRELRLAVDENPKNAEAHVNLGKVYMDQNRLDEAAKEINLALKLIPEYIETQELLKSIVAMKRKGGR